MIHSAPHLLALARGSGCTGPSPCFYCGAPADASRNPAGVHVKDTFTAYSSVVAPHSNAVCDGCVLAMVDTADITYVDGTTKHMPRAAMRMNSWIITATSAVAANKGHLDRLRAVCLSPPAPQRPRLVPGVPQGAAPVRVGRVAGYRGDGRGRQGGGAPQGGRAAGGVSVQVPGGIVAHRARGAGQAVAYA